MKQAIIRNGVKNLKEFGYPYVTETNILTDEIYKMFFKSMLEDNLGTDKKVDSVIIELIKEINNVETINKTN